MIDFAHPDVDRLFGETVLTRLDRLQARLKALLLLSLAEQRRVIKDFASRRPRPGFVDGTSGQLETRPNAANVSGIDDEEMSCFAVLSTGAVDRVGDVVVPAGVDLTAYERNPVVLLNHQAETSLPIGTTRDPRTGRCTVRVDVPNNRLTARLYFARDNELAQQVWNLVQQGILSGVSIGFNPLSPPRALPSGGNRFDHWELLEVSLVNVPCNAQALVSASDVLRTGKIEGRAPSP